MSTNLEMALQARMYPHSVTVKSRRRYRPQYTRGVVDGALGMLAVLVLGFVLAAVLL